MLCPAVLRSSVYLSWLVFREEASEVLAQISSKTDSICGVLLCPVHIQAFELHVVAAEAL